MTEEPRGRRTGGRAGRQAARLAAVAETVPFITRELAPVEVLSEEGLATIEENADTILEKVGIEFRGAPDALELLKGAGCDVDGERVRFPRGSPASSSRPARARVRPARAQPRADRAPRRHRDRARARVRLAVRP